MTPSASGQDEHVEPAMPVRPSTHELRGFAKGVLASLAGLLVFSGLGALQRAPAPSPSAAPSSPIAEATPEIKPHVTPALACVDEPGEPPVVVLEANGRGHTPGAMTSATWHGVLTTPGFYDPVVNLNGADRTDLVISDRRCAVEWQVDIDGVVVQGEHNPALDPRIAAQNRFALPLRVTLVDLHRVRASLHFDAGTVVYEWQVRVGYDIAQLYLVPLVPRVSPEEYGLTLAVPGCGFGILLGNGNRLIGGCDVAPGAEIGRAFAKPGSQIAFRRPEWVIRPAADAVSCGPVVPAIVDFVAAPECPFGPGGDPSEALSMTAPPDPGVWLLRIQACLSSGADTLCGPWFAEVQVLGPDDTLPPPPTPGGNGG